MEASNTGFCRTINLGHTYFSDSKKENYTKSEDDPRDKEEPKIEDHSKNEEDPRNEDNLEMEDHPKNQDNCNNEDNLKNKDNQKKIRQSKK